MFPDTLMPAFLLPVCAVVIPILRRVLQMLLDIEVIILPVTGS